MTSEANDTAEAIDIPGRLSLLLIAPLSGLAQSALSPVLPKISAHFAGQPEADVLVRLLVSSVPAAMILGSLVGGILTERFGQRRMLLWMLAAYAVAGSAGFLMADLQWILVSRIFLGIFNAGAGVIAAAIITTRIPMVHRNKWLGFFMMAGTFGSIGILLLAGALGAHDWRLVFLLHGIAVPVLLLIALLLPADSRPPRTTRSVAGGRIPFALAFYGAAIGAIASTAVIFLPYHLAEIGEGDPQRVASAILPNAFVGGVVAFSYGWIRRYLGIIEVFAIGFVAAAIGTLLIVWTATFTGALVGMALVGCAIGFAGPNLFAASAEAAPPERRARTIGIVRAGFYSGPLLAQLSLEPLSLSYGAGSALAALGTFALLMVGLTYLGRRALVPAY